MAKQKSRIQKFINYTREAFFFPAHLASLAVITTLAALSIFLVPQLFPFNAGIAVSSIILMAGGLELSILSAISRNPRFIRAINAKYQKDIDAFTKTKTLVDYYNELTRDSQIRFDKLRKRIKQVRKGFKKMNTTIPSVIENFVKKLNAIELSYARLLYFKDRFPEISKEDALHETVTEIDKLNQELKNASSRLKKIKEQRLKILEKRMDNYYKLQENKEVIEEQLQTIEEMVEYIKDQPITVQNTEREDMMIENLLFETEQTQQTMEEIENLMQSEFYPGVVDDFDLGEGNKSHGDSLSE